MSSDILSGCKAVNEALESLRLELKLAMGKLNNLEHKIERTESYLELQSSLYRCLVLTEAGIDENEDLALSTISDTRDTEGGVVKKSQDRPTVAKSKEYEYIRDDQPNDCTPGPELENYSNKHGE